MQTKVNTDTQLTAPKLNLKELKSKYEANAKTLVQITNGTTAYKEKDNQGKPIFSSEMIRLGKEIDGCLKKLFELVECSLAEDKFCNETFLLYINMSLLQASYFTAIESFDAAFEVNSISLKAIKENFARLDYRNDTNFQTQVFTLFVYFDEVVFKNPDESWAIQLFQNARTLANEFIPTSCDATYQKNYKTFGEIINSETPFKMIIDNQLFLTEKASKLQKEIKENLKRSAFLMDANERNDCFNNKAFILHVKIVLLYAEFNNVIEQMDSAFDGYHHVYQLVKKYIQKLNYETDPLFQQQVTNLFRRFKSMRATNPEFGKKLEQIKQEILLFTPEFLDKCGNSIVKFAQVYDDCIEEFVNKRNRDTALARESFFASARQVKASCEKMRIDGQLPLQYQLYMVEINYFMINISELTHPRSVWLSRYLNNQIIFVVNPETVNAESLKSYLSFWIGLKKLYIEPSLAIIKNIDPQVLLLDIHMLRYFQPILSDWLYVIEMPANFFRHWADLYLKPKTKGKAAKKNLFETLPKGTADTILMLGSELEFLITSSELIADFIKRCNKILATNGLKPEDEILEMVSKTTPKIKELKTRINALRSQIKVQQEKETKLANLAAAEMAKIEDQKRRLREEKLREKQLAILNQKREEQNQQPQAESESEEDEELQAPLVVIHKSVLDLQDIDAESLKLARSLKRKTEDSYEILTNRIKKEFAIPSKEQGQAFQEISAIVIGYYDLVSLYEKHKELSQKPEVKCQANLQIGIKASQIELQKTSRFVHENIEAILGLIDKLITLGKEGKAKTIYSMGQKYLKNHPEEDQSDANIIKQGKRIFRAIGEKKQLNNEEFSEHTQQREFLETMKLTFSGLGYLQLKLKPYLYENYNEALNNNSYFSNGNSQRKKAGITYGRFQGMMGFAFKGQYEKSNDSRHLREALEHFTLAFNFFKKTNHSEALCEASYHLGSIKDLLAQKSQDKKLELEALNHYKEALSFNETASKKFDLARREKILNCISAIEPEFDSASLSQCQLQG